MSENHRNASKLIYAIMVVLLGAITAAAQNNPDPLKSGFENPPEGARPRVWWHWMNGNITKEGIKLDLEWMHRVGLGGFQNFDAALATPQVVDKRLAYMTPEWKDAFKYATMLADQLGLEEAIAGSPGWSESGGPWVPAIAGNEEVCLERDARGRRQAVHGHAGLIRPRTPGRSRIWALKTMIRRDFKAPQFYADSAVVAYRVPASDVPIDDLAAQDYVERRQP